MKKKASKATSSNTSKMILRSKKRKNYVMPSIRKCSFLSAFTFSKKNPKTAKVTKSKKKRKVAAKVTSSQKLPILSAFATYAKEPKLIEENKENVKKKKLGERKEISPEIMKLNSLPQIPKEPCVAEANLDSMNYAENLSENDSQNKLEEQGGICIDEEVDSNPPPEVTETSLLDKLTRLSNETFLDLEKNFEILPLTPNRSHVLLGFNNDCKDIKVFGCGYVKAIKGCISVLGHCLHPKNEKEIFYAPTTHCALWFEPAPNDSSQSLDNDEFDLKNLLERDLLVQQSSAANDMLQKCDVVLLLSTAWNDTKSHTLPGYPDVYKMRSNDGGKIDKLSSGTYVVKTDKYFECYPSYKTVYSEISSSFQLWRSGASVRTPVILTAGGKSTGKSTFNRYLINKLLQSSWCDKIIFLECDLGQPEFTVPGFISLTEVSSPILGPPFTHVTTPLYSVFFGDITLAGEPDLYIESIKNVFSKVNHLGIPIVVNTMGWNKSLGVNLLLDTIHIVEPTYVLQITSPRESKNFPSLSRKFVQESDGWSVARVKELPDFTHLVLNTFLTIPEVQFYNPSDLRNLRLLSYLFDLQTICSKRDGKTESKLSFAAICNLQPYVVKLSDVLLCVARGTGIPKTLSLALFNASIIGLCITDQAHFNAHKSDEFFTQPPVCECIGLGIVRGVDPQNKNLFVISHLPREDLKKVNCLSLGVLNIPDSLYLEYGKKVRFKEDDLPPYTFGDYSLRVTGSHKFRVHRNFLSKS